MKTTRYLTVLLALFLLLGTGACSKPIANTADAPAPTESALSWQDQYDLGLRFLSEGNYQEAIIAFTLAIEIDPKRVEAYTELANAYIAIDDINAASDILQQGIDATGNNELVNRLSELSSVLAQGTDMESASFSNKLELDSGGESSSEPELEYGTTPSIPSVTPEYELQQEPTPSPDATPEPSLQLEPLPPQESTSVPDPLSSHEQSTPDPTIEEWNDFDFSPQRYTNYDGAHILYWTQTEILDYLNAVYLDGQTLFEDLDYYVNMTDGSILIRYETISSVGGGLHTVAVEFCSMQGTIPDVRMSAYNFTNEFA